jgi:hypothetical protein
MYSYQCCVAPKSLHSTSLNVSYHNEYPTTRLFNEPQILAYNLPIEMHPSQSHTAISAEIS